MHGSPEQTIGKSSNFEVDEVIRHLCVIKFNNCERDSSGKINVILDEASAQQLADLLDRYLASVKHNTAMDANRFLQQRNLEQSSTRTAVGPDLKATEFIPGYEIIQEGYSNRMRNGRQIQYIYAKKPTTLEYAFKAIGGKVPRIKRFGTINSPHSMIGKFLLYLSTKGVFQKSDARTDRELKNIRWSELSAMLDILTYEKLVEQKTESGSKKSIYTLTTKGIDKARHLTSR